MNVNVLEARNQLSALLRHVEQHPQEKITISRRGVPIADIVSHTPERNAISLGVAAGEYSLPEDWDINEGDDEIAALLGA